jgi:hypothetical protein
MLGLLPDTIPEIVHTIVEGLIAAHVCAFLFWAATFFTSSPKKIRRE